MGNGESTPSVTDSAEPPTVVTAPNGLRVERAQASRLVDSAEEVGASDTDAVLLERWRAYRDEAAFESLVARYRPFLLNYARRFVVTDEDTTQELVAMAFEVLCPDTVAFGEATATPEQEVVMLLGLPSPGVNSHPALAHLRHELEAARHPHLVFVNPPIPPLPAPYAALVSPVDSTQPESTGAGPADQPAPDHGILATATVLRGSIPLAEGMHVPLIRFLAAQANPFSHETNDHQSRRFH